MAGNFPAFGGPGSCDQSKQHQVLFLWHHCTIKIIKFVEDFFLNDPWYSVININPGRYRPHRLARWQAAILLSAGFGLHIANYLYKIVWAVSHLGCQLFFGHFAKQLVITPVFAVSQRILRERCISPFFQPLRQTTQLDKVHFILFIQPCDCFSEWHIIRLERRDILPQFIPLI